MSLIQKLKIVVQLFFISGIFLLNAAVYQKYNYFSSAQHLSYLPSTTVLSVTVNVNKLSGAFIQRFFYKNEEMIQLLEDFSVDQKDRNQFISSGIDATDQISFFMTNNLKSNHFKFAGVLVDLNSRNNAEDQLISTGFKQILKGNTSVFAKNKVNYAVCNDEVMAFVFFKDSSYSEQSKTNTLTEFLSGNNRSEIGQLIEQKINQSNDVVIYGLPQNLSDQQLWMNHFIAAGNLNDDAFEFSIDFDFNSDITQFFPEHKINSTYNFDDLDGYLYMNSVFKAGNAAGIFDKLTMIKINDSLQHLLKPALLNQSSTGLTLYSYDLAKASLKVSDESPLELRLLSKNFFLPAFDFKLHCSNSTQIDTVFADFAEKGKLSFESNGWYKWSRDEFYNLYFGMKKDWLNIATKRNDQNQWPETGYSNVFYFNADKFNDKLPDMTARYMADQFRIFEYFLVYTTKVEKNKLNAKGKLVFTSGNDSMLEILRIMAKFKEIDLTAIAGTMK